MKEYKPAGSFVTNEKFTHVFKGTSSPSSRNMFFCVCNASKISKQESNIEDLVLKGTVDDILTL